MDSSRRAAIGLVVGVPAALLSACGESGEQDVTANEDLMREHGVLRRALLVYREAARRARSDASTIPLSALHDTATLFRRFGEDYHERKLEEAYIFPQVSKADAALRTLTATLKSQHDRAREITDYILAISSGQRFPSGDAAGFAQAMDTLDLMYEHHAAIEDTIIFPAWKKAIGSHDYDSMGDKFEDIEKQTFGHDGFDDAVKQIAKIEEAFGLSDLARFTPPPPPKS